MCENLCNSYITRGFVRSPIIAGMVVTLITLMIVYYSKTRDVTRLFILASLANMGYLFFHTYALSTSIKSRGASSNLLSEFTGLYATEGIEGGEEFKPTSI